MRKNNMLLLILTAFLFSFSFSVIAENPSEKLENVIHQEIGIEAGQFAYLIARRFYLIQRLTPIITFLLQNSNKVNVDYVFNNNPYNIIDMAQFEHPRVIESIRNIQKQINLKPLFLVWEDFIAYKSLQDQVFIEDFSKEILIVSLGLSPAIAPTRANPLNPVSLVNSFKQMSLEGILERLDTIVSPPRKVKPIKTAEKDISLASDLNYFVTLNDVALRFYILMRLEGVIELFRKVHPTLLLVSEKYLSIKESATEYSFTNRRVIQCYRKTQRECTLASVLSFIKELGQFKYIKESDLTRDFLCLIIEIEHSLIARKSIKKTKSDLSTVLTLYEQLDSLPLEEILDAIDIVTSELPPLLEQYQFNSKLSWRSWLKKFWWAPPLIVSIIGIKVLLAFKNHS